MNSYRSEIELKKIAASMLSLGSAQSTLTKVNDGGNNRGYVYVVADRKYFLKEYFRGEIGLYNRGKQECAFSAFLRANHIAASPTLIAFNEQESIALFDFIEGSNFSGVTIQKDHVQQAIDFIQTINQHRQTEAATSLPRAIESCFTIEEHLQVVAARIERLFRIDSSIVIAEQANQFIHGELVPFWDRQQQKFKQQTGSAEVFSAPLPANQRCLSPSDFGFHNALLVKDTVKFFDFEYAGWDDPAKLICDFFYQPKIPVPMEFFNPVVEGIAPALEISFDSLRQRVTTLFPIYGIKWCCILLNDVLRDGNSRRVFSGQSEVTERQKMQLQKAQKLFLRLSEDTLWEKQS